MPILARRQDAAAMASSADTSAMSLSTGAIAGIAVGGAVVIFAGLALLLVQLARWQDRRRAEFACPDISVECGAETVAPRRLRKKSVTGDHVVVESVPVSGDSDENVGREESESRHSSLHVISSATYSRPGSASIRGSTEGGSRRGSTDAVQARAQRQKQRSPEKQKGYDVYDHRRKSSWIDEDALHGPTVVSPKNAKQKHGRKVSWFDGGLGRSLSRLSIKSNTTERMGSPTLPYTETGSGRQLGTPTESHDKQAGRPVSAPQTMPNGRYLTPHVSQQQQQVYISPWKAYVPSSAPCPSSGSGSSSPAKSPSNGLHSPQRGDHVAIEAAQQLAGDARLPGRISIPQTQTPRPPRFKHSATDTELTEILRMTAERLQDGNRSARRQTLMLPYSPRRLLDGRSQFDTSRGYVALNSESSDGGDISPVKSHKSAPATLMYSELEGDQPQPQPQALQRQMHTPKHSRHLSRMSLTSQVSMVSEPDSLIASKRDSQLEMQTALSSPSRVPRTAADATPSPQVAAQQTRPFSNASSMSSALSTLYSMEEASIRSPPISESKLEGSPMDREKRARGKILSAFDMLHENHAQDPREEQGSPKFAFEDGGRPQPLRIRRGTLGRMSMPNNSMPSRSTSCRETEKRDLPKSGLSFTIHALDDSDPFTAMTPKPPRDPARLSKIFSPLPVELPREEADPERSVGGKTIWQTDKPIETPTPSPTRRRVLRLSQDLQAGIGSPTPSNTERAPSPVMSEAGLSSVYDSYCYNETVTDTLADNATTPIAVPIARFEASPTKLAGNIPTSGRVSRTGSLESNNHQQDGSDIEKRQSEHEPVIRVLDSQPRPRRSAPSDESIYSQDDEDTVPPLPTRKAKSSNNVRITNTVAELRRMNSQVSTFSDHSVTNATDVGSPTLPEIRGGGFSPGVRRSGGKNYLALGMDSESGGKSTLSNGNRADPLGDAASRAEPSSPIRRSRAARARRGTIMMRGFDARMKELDETREALRGGHGGNGIGANGMKQGVQLLTHAAKLKHGEAAAKRASVESLYDEKGFLKGLP